MDAHQSSKLKDRDRYPTPASGFHTGTRIESSVKPSTPEPSPVSVKQTRTIDSSLQGIDSNIDPLVRDMLSSICRQLIASRQSDNTSTVKVEVEIKVSS